MLDVKIKKKNPSLNLRACVFRLSPSSPQLAADPSRPTRGSRKPHYVGAALLQGAPGLTS